jgi:hypothetical protein
VQISTSFFFFSSFLLWVFRGNIVRRIQVYSYHFPSELVL